MRICESHYVFRLHLRVLLLRCTLASAPHSYACAAGESRPRCDLRVCAFRAAPRMPHPSRGRMSGRRPCGIKYRLIASASGMCPATFPFFYRSKKMKSVETKAASGGKSPTRPHADALLGTHAFFRPPRKRRSRAPESTSAARLSLSTTRGAHRRARYLLYELRD